jgi:hypothetical protein
VALLQLLYSIRCKRQLPDGETTQPGDLGSRTGHDGLPRQLATQDFLSVSSGNSSRVATAHVAVRAIIS